MVPELSPRYKAKEPLQPMGLPPNQRHMLHEPVPGLFFRPNPCAGFCSPHPKSLPAGEGLQTPQPPILGGYLGAISSRYIFELNREGLRRVETGGCVRSQEGF
jgi:hypothetical protein